MVWVLLMTRKGANKGSERKRMVAVIGGGQCSQEEARLAREIGRRLAQEDVILVCGGMGGVMEAACKGAREKGGVTIGILPGEIRAMANAYVQIPIVAGIGYARNVAVVKSAQAVIAIGGSYGTLSEIGHALQSNIPVIGLNTWALAKNGSEDGAIIVASSPDEAVHKALSLIKD